MFERYFMRSLWLLSLGILTGTVLMFRAGSANPNWVGAYDSAAFGCLAYGFLAGALLMFSEAVASKGFDYKNTTSHGAFNSMAWMVFVSIIAVEGVGVWAAHQYFAALLLFAGSLIAGCIAATWTYYQRKGTGTAWEKREYWTLAAHAALLPAALVSTLFFLADPSISPAWMTPIGFPGLHWVAAALMIIQFVWATELDHALIHRTPHLRLTKTDREAA